MKNIFWYATLTATTVSFCPTPTQAQEDKKSEVHCKWEFGLKFTPGISYSTYRDLNGNILSSGSASAYSAEAFAEKALSKRWALRAGLQFANRTGETKLPQTAYTILYRTSVLNLELKPEMLFYFFSEGRIRFYGSVGAILGNNLRFRGTEKNLKTGEQKTIVYDQLSYFAYSIGVALGLGCEVGLSPRVNLFVEGTAETSLWLKNRNTYYKFIGLSIGAKLRNKR